MRGWLLLGAIVAATSLVFAEAAPAISQADAKRLLRPVRRRSARRSCA